MGFGDENFAFLENVRGTADNLASEICPNLDTVPGGDHEAWREMRRAVAYAGPAILNKLASDGLIEIEAVKLKYGGA